MRSFKEAVHTKTHLVTKWRSYTEKEIFLMFLLSHAVKLSTNVGYPTLIKPNMYRRSSEM